MNHSAPPEATATGFDESGQGGATGHWRRREQLNAWHELCRIPSSELENQNLPRICQNNHIVVVSMNRRQEVSAVSEYIKQLQGSGRYLFTTEEALMALKSDRNSIVRALKRLMNKDELTSPKRGYYVIVPPEFKILGCLPPDQFIPQLMEKSGYTYYVGLLSAAQIHGAAHQKPQRFQVMVNKPHSAINCGRIHVDFHVRTGLEHSSTVEINTARGVVRVATPETTAIELVGYVKDAGGLDTIATVIMELAEILRADQLIEEAARSSIAWSQRLGFILEQVGAAELANALYPFVQKHANRVVPLNTALPRTGFYRSKRWLVAVNTEVEPDL